MIEAALAEELGLPGHLRAVPDEIDARADALTVTGVLPPELNGRYLRNGPNPLPGQPVEQIQGGPGMLHGVRLRDGRAEWYRNRWVRTGAFHGRPFVGPDGFDRTAVPANTHVIRHARRIFALVEVGLPYEVTPDLATVGPCDFGGRLTTGMTAHPKRDPATGELHFFGYGFFPPFLTYHRLNAAGELVMSREVAVPAGTMTHDFALTERHCVWLDLPVTFDFGAPGMPFRWNDAYGARLGLMRHDVPDDPVQWFEIEPCFIFHVGNAYEDGSRVVVHGLRYSRREFASLWELVSRTGPLTGPEARGGRAYLHRWTLDRETGRATEEPLDDQEAEFPTFNETLLGRPSRHLYTVTATDPRCIDPCALIKYDTVTGTTTARHELGPEVLSGEAVFVPGRGAAASREDDGWLISIATRRDGSGSQLQVRDATDLSLVGGVELPRAVPTGFHGSWFPDE